jgi:two-component system alkaline phosphatase synthesis response regulator PhoP
MQAEKKTDAASKRPLSILIADDDADALLMLIMMLRDEGHIVHTCAGAKFVVEAVSRYQPDVCILDIVMPRQTGFGIVRELVAMNPPRRPLLIALSGVFNEPTDEILAKTAGFDLLVPKRTEPGELLRIIEALATDEPAQAA